jgi:hypothetical protein
LKAVTRYFVTRKGDVLGEIETCLRVEPATFEQENGLIHGHAIERGRHLLISGEVSDSVLRACQRMRRRQTGSLVDWIYDVRSGDMLSFIGEWFQTPERDLLRWNVIRTPDRLDVRQPLVVKKLSAPAPSAPTPADKPPTPAPSDEKFTPVVEPSCNSPIQPGAGANRTVLFSDGDLPRLYGKYMTMLAQHGISLDFDTLTVIYYDDQKAFQQIECKKNGPWEMTTCKGKWKDGLLKGKRARRVDNWEYFSSTKGYDVVCP